MTKRRDASARSKVLLQAYLSEPLRHRWSFPDDFLDSAVPGVSEGDIVILRLLSAREQAASEDPKRARQARAFLGLMHRATYRRETGSTELRRWVMGMAIDSATSLASEVPIDLALENAETIIRSEFPDVSIPRDVLARAVELAPTKSKHKSAAYHALAKILRCDAPTLMAMLRADRKERRDVGKRS